MERRKPSTRFRGEPPPKRAESPPPAVTPRFKKARFEVKAEAQAGKDEQPPVEAAEVTTEPGKTFLERYEFFGDLALLIFQRWPCCCHREIPLSMDG